jgi:hypothetical protein
MNNMVLQCKDGGDFKPHPEGIHPAVCVDVMDLGLVETEFQGQKRLVNKVKLVFESEQKLEDGTTCTVSRNFTASLHPKAKLADFLGKWRGRAVTPGETVDLAKLIGANCTLVISHQQNMSGKTYASIDAVSAMPIGKPSTKAPPRWGESPREPCLRWGESPREPLSLRRRLKLPTTPTSASNPELGTRNCESAPRTTHNAFTTVHAAGWRPVRSDHRRTQSQQSRGTIHRPRRTVVDAAGPALRRAAQCCQLLLVLVLVLVLEFAFPTRNSEPGTKSIHSKRGARHKPPSPHRMGRGM